MTDDGRSDADGARRRSGGGSTGALEGTAMNTGTIQLKLMSGFELRVDGTSVDVPSNAQRVLAYLALRDRPLSRMNVASALWLDLTEARAAANLRTALWRLQGLRDRLIWSRGSSIGLAVDVDVDLSTVVREARALIEPCDASTGAFGDPPAVSVDHLAGDLLPEWDEDWILFERERLRQLRIHAMEALSRRLRALGRVAEAVDAVSADPMRESAHRALIEAHLAEGNVADARRQFDQFRRLLWDALALVPSSDLCRLVGVRAPNDP
jgi:DNA-binding SARP family transcriptional activator